MRVISRLVVGLLPVVGVFHAVRLAVGDDDGGVVQEPVEDGDGGVNRPGMSGDSIC